MTIILLLFLSIVFIILSTTKFNLHPFLALLLVALGFGLFSGMPLPDIIKSINEGFGGTIGKIGIIIIAGTIIGTFLEQSGGAFAIAEKIIKAIGEKHILLAMAIIGYIVSIPVFADSGFIILSPLNKALSKKVNMSLAGSAVALGLGLTASHTMVPPTPGPIAAAGILKADLGLIIALGVPISLATLFVCWLFAKNVANRIYIDPNPEVSEEVIAAKIKQAPSAFKSFVPILIPILLIVISSIANLPSRPLGDDKLTEILVFLGEPFIALFIGVLTALTLPKKFDSTMLSTTGWVGKSLLDAAIIILITGAGGAFGKVLQNSGIATVIGDQLSAANLGILLPFILASGIKTAQGSSTVAIITTASIIAPLMPQLGLESGIAKALAVIAIGAGSAVISHANDSFFWVFTQLNGMDVKTGYRLHSIGTGILGITAALLVWLVSLVLL